MRFGCCLNMIAKGPDGTGIEYIEALAKAGFDYAELPLAEMMALPDGQFQELVRRVAGSGVHCEACNNFFPKTERLTGESADLGKSLDYARRAMDRAALLLRQEPQTSVAEIAGRVGYDSASKFAAVFREAKGKTPLEYRREGR